jgi:hypothetical protein
VVLHGDVHSTAEPFELSKAAEQAILHHAPVDAAHGAEAGRRIRVVYGLPGFRASMIQGSVLPPGVGLLGDLAGGGHTPLMLSATSFACGAHCLPRARHPTFDTAAKVELPLSHSHPHTRPHT